MPVMVKITKFNIDEQIKAMYSSDAIGTVFFHNDFAEKIDVAISNDSLCSDDNSAESEIRRELLESKYKFIKKRPLRTLYFCTSYECNLACSYCITDKSISVNRPSTKMSFEVAHSAIDYFFRNSTPKTEREVVLYGGEPTMYPALLRYIYETVREYEKKDMFSELVPCRFILCTNGILLDNDLLAFIQKSDIYTCVSIDGTKNIHDEFRRNKEGEGSYDQSRKGYELLQKSGLKAGITMTLGTHLSAKLPELVTEIYDTFSPNTLAINTLVDFETDIKNQWIPNAKDQSEVLWKAFEVCRDKGLYLVKSVMDNRVRPFVEKRPRYWGCTGMGARIGVLPSGDIVPCMALTHEFSFNLRDEPQLDEIYPDFLLNGSPFERSDCALCYAKSTCGGGCPASSHLKGHKSPKDEAYCVASRYFLRSLIDLLWELCKECALESIQEKGFYIPSEFDRRKIYGKIDVQGKVLDYQHTPQSI